VPPTYEVKEAQKGLNTELQAQGFPVASLTGFTITGCSTWSAAMSVCWMTPRTARWLMIEGTQISGYLASESPTRFVSTAATLYSVRPR
jgi:hypothetical protein